LSVVRRKKKKGICPPIFLFKKKKESDLSSKHLRGGKKGKETEPEVKKNCHLKNHSPSADSEGKKGREGTRYMRSAESGEKEATR